MKLVLRMLNRSMKKSHDRKFYKTKVVPHLIFGRRYFMQKIAIPNIKRDIEIG